MSPQSVLDVPDGMVVRRSAVGVLGLYPLDGPTRPADGLKALDGVRGRAVALQGASVDYSPEERYVLLKATGLTHEVLLAEVAEVKYDTSPVGTPGGRQNWVDKAGGLPPFIRAVAHALIRSGKSKSRAIAIAVGTIKRWARGGGNVTAKTRAKAAATIARWEAMKARSGKEWALDLSTKSKHTSSDFKPCGRCGSNRVAFPPGKQPRCAACQFHVGLKDSAREEKANYTPEQNRRRGEAALAAGAGGKKPRRAGSRGGAKKPTGTRSARRIVRTEEGAARYNARIGDIIEDGKVVGHDDGEQFREIGPDGTSSIVEAADAAATNTRNARSGMRKAKTPLKSARGTSPNGSDLEKFENGRAKYKDGSIYTTDGWVSPPKRSPSGAKPAKVRQDGSVIYSDGQVFDPATGKVAVPEGAGAKDLTNGATETKALLLSASLVDIAMEFKGIVRHVRTPAGVARFKQPIGSIITAKGRRLFGNLTSREPVWEGYERVKGANGKLYDIGKEDDGRWYAYDTRENVVAESDDQEEVYDLLDGIAKTRPTKKPVAKTPVKKPVRRAPEKPAEKPVEKEPAPTDIPTVKQTSVEAMRSGDQVFINGTGLFTVKAKKTSRVGNDFTTVQFTDRADLTMTKKTRVGVVDGDISKFENVAINSLKPGDTLLTLNLGGNGFSKKTVKKVTQGRGGHKVEYTDGSHENVENTLNSNHKRERIYVKFKDSAKPDAPEPKKPLAPVDPKPVVVPPKPQPVARRDDDEIAVPTKTELANMDDEDLSEMHRQAEEDAEGGKAERAYKAEIERRGLVSVDDLKEGDRFIASVGSYSHAGREFEVVDADGVWVARDVRSGQDYPMDNGEFGTVARRADVTDPGGTDPLFGPGSRPSKPSAPEARKPKGKAYARQLKAGDEISVPYSRNPDRIYKVAKVEKIPVQRDNRTGQQFTSDYRILTEDGDWIEVDKVDQMNVYNRVVSTVPGGRR